MTSKFSRDGLNMDIMAALLAAQIDSKLIVSQVRQLYWR